MVADDPETFADLDGHDVAFADDRLAQQADNIAKESPSFAQELDAAKKDSSIDVKVVERGVRTNEQGSNGDTSVSITDENGVTHVVTYVDSYRTSDNTVEHEWGHEKDARTEAGTKFVRDAIADKKKYPDKSQHNGRPVEQSANAFRDKVNEERKGYRKEQKE